MYFRKKRITNKNREWRHCEKKCILTSSVRSSGKIIAYIIGIYRKKESKVKITEEVKKIINRIKRKWVNPNILVFGDMNESKDSQVTKLERVWKLASPHLNKTIITRDQNVHGNRRNRHLITLC